MPFAPAVPFSTGYLLVGLFACPVPQMPEINVRFQNPPPIINQELGPAALAQMREQSVSPKYNGEFPEVEGINNGGFMIEHAIDFSTGIRPILNNACISVSKIEIIVTYNSTIYIDKRAREGSCRYNMILEHEMKHVATDISVMKDYLPFITHMTEAIAGQWKTTEPIEAFLVEKKQAAMSKHLSRALNTITDNLQRTRLLLQPLVDTHAEYTRVSNACADKRWDISPN